MLKLIIKEPRQEIKEFQLESKEYIMGRDETCDITLKDKTAADKHANLYFKERSFIIKPIGKDSRVLVNEKEIEEETVLTQGDELLIGKTKIEMEIKESDIDKMLEEMAGDNAQQEPTAQKTLDSLSDTRTLDARELIIPQTHSEEKHKGYLIFIRIQNILRKNKRLVIACVILVFTAYIISVIVEERKNQAKRIQKDKITNLGSPPSVEEKMVKQAVTFLLKNANENIADHKWVDAISKYKQILDIEPEHEEVDVKLKNAEKELENQKLLESGLSLINDKQYEKGIDTLSKIPEESFYYMRAVTEIIFAGEELQLSESKEKYKRPRTKTEIGRAKEHSVINQAINLYANGQTDMAISQLNPVLKTGKWLKKRAASLGERMRKARSLFNKGLTEYKNNKLKNAMNAWEKMIRIDKTIAGGKKTQYKNRAYAYLADEHFKRAERDLSRKNFIGAARYSTKVLMGNSSHSGALRIRSFLSKRAKKLYEEGYVLEGVSPEGAVKKWKEIIATCLPSNEYYQKAKVNIAKYE